MTSIRHEVTAFCQVGDRNIGQVASDLNPTETALRDWVRRAEIDAGNGPTSALTSDERDELARLRRKNKRVLMDLEILKNAVAFLARGNQ